MKKIYLLLSVLLTALLLTVGVVSVVDADSPSGDGKLTEKPNLSLAAVADGSYMKQMEAYYSDFFPLRDKLLDVSNRMRKNMLKWSFMTVKLQNTIFPSLKTLIYPMLLLFIKVREANLMRL